MYEIHKKADHLVVEFLGDFNCMMLKTIINHEISMREYLLMNDIWLIGKHHACITLGDVLSIVDELPCRCSETYTGRKTAFVVEPGLTEGILQILAKGFVRKLPFECRVFHTLDEARDWLGVADSKVA